MMALAIMHGKGRVASKMDSSKQGQVEDRRDVEQPELARLRSSLGNMGLPQGEPLEDLGGSQMAKDAGIEDIGRSPSVDLSAHASWRDGRRPRLH